MSEKTVADFEMHSQDVQRRSANGETIRCFVCGSTISPTLETRAAGPWGVGGPWWVYECKCAKYGTCAPANKAVFV